MIMSRRHFNSYFFLLHFSWFIDTLSPAREKSKKRFKRNGKGNLSLLFLFFTFRSLHFLLSDDRLFGSSPHIETTRNPLSSHWFLEFQHISIQIRFCGDLIEYATRTQKTIFQIKVRRITLFCSYKLQLCWLCIWLETKKSEIQREKVKLPLKL